MDKKVIFYYILIVTFSTLSMFGKFLDNKLFYFTLIALAIIHLFYLNLYSYISGIKLSNGLLYSLISGTIILLILTNFDFVIESPHRATDYFFFLSILIAILCAIIYFSVDRLFDKKYKNFSKIRLFFCSLGFYVINYIISFIVAFILGGSQAVAFG